MSIKEDLHTVELWHAHDKRVTVWGWRCSCGKAAECGPKQKALEYGRKHSDGE